MVDPNSPHSDEKVLVRRGRVDSVNLYEVKEHGIRVIREGSSRNAAIELCNFCIFNCLHMYSCFSNS